MLGFWVSGGGGAETWTELTDTPASITASRPVVGNSGGTALEFGGNALTDYLRRDGSNTVTGDILPDGAATRSFGSFTSQFDRIDSEKLAVGYKVAGTTGTIDFLPLYGGGIGGIVGAGSIKGPSTTMRIRAGSAYYAPVATFGNLWSNNANQVVEILNYGGGSFVTGSSFAAASGGVARIRMDNYAYGAFLGGYAFAAAASATALLRNYGPGSFVWGYTAPNANATQIIESSSAARGSFTLGRTSATGDHTITSTAAGAFTAGECTGNSPAAHLISGSGIGSFAQGRCFGSTPSGQILASGQGAFAQGRCANYAQINSSARGSFAQGSASNTGAYITASAHGSFAHGQSASGSGILASGAGSFAAGNAAGGNVISATTTGSFAFGDAATGNITASAINAFQFGPGVNAAVNSLQVGQTGALGTGIHFHAGGAPGVPVNGDMWVTAAGAVTIFSGGVACVATNAVM